MMKFGLPPWLRRAGDAGRALVKYVTPPAVDLTDADEENGWTPATLAAYHQEADVRAMAFVAASMDGRLRPRARWANSKYRPLHWRARA